MQRQFGLPRARTTGTSPCLSSATELLSADTASYQRMVLFLLMVFVPLMGPNIFGIEVWTTIDDHRRPSKTNEDDESPSEFQITVLPFSNDERPSRPFRSGQRRAWQICGGMCQDQSTLIVHGHPRFDS